jgi:hypothetical protein
LKVKARKDGFGGGRNAEGLRTLSEDLKTSNSDWVSLREKLILGREIRLAEIAKRDSQPKSMEELFWTAGGEKLRLTRAEERDLMHRIQGYGEDVSSDLAAIRLPFNPFMSDVVFEKAYYNGAGSVSITHEESVISGNL